MLIACDFFVIRDVFCYNNINNYKGENIMALSTLRKYQLITGEDLFKSASELSKISEQNDFNKFTNVAEPIFYALNLANDMVDINEAKKLYNASKLSHDLGDYEFNINDLMRLMQVTIGLTKNDGE